MRADTKRLKRAYVAWRLWDGPRSLKTWARRQVETKSPEAERAAAWLARKAES